jgi:tripartite-type tricarboxylate transporter receptor subunit TctC
MKRRLALATLAAGAAASALPFTAAAQPRPLRFVVPYPPGGPLDIVARALAERVKDSLGVVIVENRPGAGGNLGADAVAKSPPDGSTIVMGAVATHAINPWLYAKLPYDPIRDFTPITGVAQVPNVLVMSPEVASRLGIASVADLVAYARRTGKLNYGSGGNGSRPPPGEMSGPGRRVHGPFPMPAAGAAGAARRRGRHPASTISRCLGLKTGKLKALAVTTAKRSSACRRADVAGAGKSLASAASTSTPGSASSASPSRPTHAS